MLLAGVGGSRCVFAGVCGQAGSSWCGEELTAASLSVYYRAIGGRLAR